MPEIGQEVVPNRSWLLFNNWVSVLFGSNKDLKNAFVGCNKNESIQNDVMILLL